MIIVNAEIIFFSLNKNLFECEGIHSNNRAGDAEKKYLSNTCSIFL